MMALPKINRAGWLATWLQNRRRARQHAMPAKPPAPVIVTFILTDNGSGTVDVDVTWTWDGQGWPDDGNFIVFVELVEQDPNGDGVRRGAIAGAVAGPGRSLSAQGVLLPASDTAYYCKVQYRKGATVSDYSAEVYGNPY